MIVLKVILVKCIRLAFNGGNLTVTFDKKITTVVGKIGSGKSSLMEYTTTKAPAYQDFDIGGYRELHCSHRGNTYIITNHKISKNKHSILKNGVELNTGFTSKAYNEFIKQEFDVTDALYELLMGDRTLTGGSTNDRKSWFNMLSVVDYDFSLNYFKKASKRLRDLVGARNHAMNNLMDSKKQDISQYNNFLNERASIKELIYALNRKYVKIEHIDFDENFHKTMVAKLDRFNKTLDDIEKPKEDLQQILVSISFNNQQRESCLSKLDDAKDPELLKDLATRIKEAEKYLLVPFTKDKLVEQLSYLKDTAPKFEALFLSLEQTFSYPELGDTIRNYEMNLNHDKHIYEELKRATNNLSNEIKILEATSKTGSVKCPKCDNEFIDGFSDKDESLLKRKKLLLTEKTIELDKTDKELSISLKNLAQAKEKQDIIDKIALLFNKDLPINNRNLLNKLNNLINHLEVLPSLYESYDKVKMSMDLENVVSKTDIEKELLGIQSSLKDLNIIKQKIETYDSLIKSKELVEQNLLESSKTLAKLEANSSIIISNNKILLDLKDLENKLNVLDTSISLIDHANIRIQSIERDIRDLDDRIVVLKQVVEALSPKSGLIGESINGFIGLVIDKMNVIIASILEYELVILPPEVKLDGEVNMDYKFRVLVNKQTTPTKDIRSLSTGQRELVDFAFLLVVYELLDLEMMLYLDEFGNRLDRYHKVKSMQYVNEVVSSRIDQIYMITHYSEGILGGDNTKLLDLSN